MMARDVKLVKALKEANPKDEKIKQLSLYSDVNHQDKEGKTPLQIAIEKKNLCLLEVCVRLACAYIVAASPLLPSPLSSP